MRRQRIDRLGAKRVIMVDRCPSSRQLRHHGLLDQRPAHARALAHGVKDDSPELFLKDTLKAGEYFNDPKLAHALCFKALESFEYIRKLGCEFAPTPFIQGGHSKIRSLAPKVSAGISVMLPLHRHFLKRGGIMRKNTIVDEIIKDETGRCVGVAVRENYVFDINSATTT
ncbi:MAG: FAD-binding protein [Sutterella wadsworthensis]